MTNRNETIRKRVEFKEVDDEEGTASGIVMVPDKLDLQGDYVTEDTIRQFAEQFGKFEEVGEAGGGIMHAVWPSGHLELAENSIADESTTIGGEDVPSGAWIQTWRMNDDELRSLVSGGVLAGYSIGAVDASWRGPMAQDDLPGDVDTSGGYPDDDPAWELTDGIIREVSSVDIPAVEDAQILETKSHDEAMKRLDDHLGSRDEFVNEAVERGHTEGEASQLWDYLNRAVDIEGATDPGTSKGVFARAGKAFLRTFTGRSEGESTDSSTKESRTLSQANRERMMAAHDALESALSSDVDFQTNRFSDDPTTDFDVADYSGKAVSGSGDGDGEQEQKSDESAESDRGDGDTQSMSNDDDPLADAPEWAKAMQENIEENSSAVEALAEKMEDDASDGDDADKDAWDEAPEWAKELRDETEKNSERLDRVAKSEAASDQIQGGAADDDDDDEMAQLAKLLG